jgi:dTDP-4-amino-4,6-dideoxygalactose transaminase|tara:strand:+ start:1432 stop:2601 length:1170 start_codon:yes stop_codon:yes gene_type:complete
MKKKYIIFGRPYLGNEEIKSVTKVIKSKWIGSGPITELFEKKFKIYKKSKYTLSVNSCTAALHLSLIYCGIKYNDEVITTPMTFASTINSIILTGAKPILADIDPNNFNIDPKEIEKKITKKTKAILIVHFAGLPCDMKSIIKIVKKYKLKLIEDCAHSIESKYYNKHVGNFGDTGCFSFYSTKNLTTGEGGMITCNKKNIYKKMRVARLHGLSKDAWKRYLPDNIKTAVKFEHYDVTEIGLKYNMIDINAAMGLVQLKKLDNCWIKRKKFFELYKKKLINLPIKTQEFENKNIKHAYHLFLIVIDKNKTKKNRDDLILFLKKNYIGCGINYRSVTDMSIYKKKFGWNINTCKNSKYLGDNTLSLPLDPNLTIKDVNFICEKVQKFFKS